MDFLKRLGFYLVGLSVGIVFLMLFFKKKSDETGVSFCYFPNCRTLKDMRSKTLSYSEEINGMLLNKTIDSTDIGNFLFHGDIDFANSDTKSTPCKTYRIEGQVKNKPAVLTVRNCKSTVQVERISVER